MTVTVKKTAREQDLAALPAATPSGGPALDGVGRAARGVRTMVHSGRWP